MSFKILSKLLSIVGVGAALLVMSHGVGIPWGCGGGAATRASTLTIEGTVSSATSSSASLSALGIEPKHAISEAAAAGEDCTLYDEDGTEVGTATTESDGTYSLTVSPTVLNPTGASEVTKTLILETESGLSNLLEVTITDSTTTVTVDADPETTLGVEAFKAKISGFTSWRGFDLSGQSLGFDPICFVRMEEEKWNLAATGGEGVAGSLGPMKDMMLAQLAAGSFGSYGGFSEMAQAFMKDSVDASFATTAAQNAATFTGNTAATYTDNYATAIDNYTSIADTFAERFAGGVGAGVSALQVKGVVDASADSLCGDMLADADLLQETVETLMKADTITEFTTAFGSDDGVSALFNTMKQFEGTGGDFTFASDWDPGAAMGLLAGYGGTFSGFDASNVKSLLEQIPTGGGTTFDYRAWGEACTKTYLQDTTAEFGDIAAYWSAQEVAGTNLNNITDPYSAFFNNGSTNYDACLDPTSSACQTIISGTTFQHGCVTNSDCPSGSTCNTGTYLCVSATVGGCGDAKCVDGETATTCPIDCNTTQVFCGNAHCETGETSTSCPYDCGSGGSCNHNSTCEPLSGENQTSCPTDCAPPSFVCGNATCETGENMCNCLTDCPTKSCPTF